MAWGGQVRLGEQDKVERSSPVADLLRSVLLLSTSNRESVGCCPQGFVVVAAVVLMFY